MTVLYTETVRRRYPCVRETTMSSFFNGRLLAIASIHVHQHMALAATGTLNSVFKKVFVMKSRDVVNECITLSIFHFDCRLVNKDD